MIKVTTLAIVWLALMMVVTLVRLASLERRIGALSRIEAKLDALVTHAGIDFDPYDQVPQAVVEALRRGEKIQAIKLYRESTGVGLREAKEFVEDLQRQRGMS